MIYDDYTPTLRKKLYIYCTKEYKSADHKENRNGIRE